MNEEETEMSTRKEQCIICFEVFSINVIVCHYNQCYQEKMAEILLNFDIEISRLKRMYEMRIKLIRESRNLGDICAKCEQFDF